MPENVHHQNDHPLEAPSLIELSAEIVANHAGHLLFTGKRGVSESATEIYLAASSSSKINETKDVSNSHSRCFLYSLNLSANCVYTIKMIFPF
jgi:hypothetical protein